MQGQTILSAPLHPAALALKVKKQRRLSRFERIERYEARREARRTLFQLRKAARSGPLLFGAQPPLSEKS